MQRVFVGDVQGCADELDELIGRVQATFGASFELWIVGDVVNRGPYSLRALSRVRELVEAGTARLVLGNHELGLILTALGLRELSRWDSFGDVLEDPGREEWIDWLLAQPVALRDRLGEQAFCLVHASVHPDWDLDELCRRAREVEARLSVGTRKELRRFLSPASGEDAVRDDLGRLLRGRSVSWDGAWASEEPSDDLVPWHRAWSLRGHRYGIVYGHWAMQGLHVAPGLRGLDTGCVHHGRGRDGSLTAWLPDPTSATPFDVPDERFWHIPARRAYYAHRDFSGR